MRQFAVAIALCMTAAIPALAQSAGEKTGINSALGVMPKTAEFVTEAAKSDKFEIASSKLAASKAQGQAKTFANQMVVDHSKTTAELKPLAQKANVQLPAEMSGSQKSMLDKLQGLSGADFAKQYASDQVSAHKSGVSLFQRYGKGGVNKELAAWASKTLPALQHHLDMANQLNR